MLEAQEPSFLKTAMLLEILSRKRYSPSYNEQIITSLNNIFNSFKSLDKIERQIVRYLFLHRENKKNKLSPKSSYENFIESITAKNSLTRQILLSGKKHKIFYYSIIKKKNYFIKKLQLLMAKRIDVTFFAETKNKQE